MSVINSNVPVATGQRSNRDLSAHSNGTTDFGRLDVLYHTEINPNEDFSINWQGWLKGATMKVPTKANMFYDVRWFFVPYRILTFRPEDGKMNFVWDYFIEKLSNTSHPYSTIADLAACLNSSSYQPSSDPRILTDLRRLMSQLRLPKALVNSTPFPGVSSNLSGSALGTTPVNLWPFQSYQRIWWDFYRDKSLIDESLLNQYVPCPQPGYISAVMPLLQKYLLPRYACWPKDYFTNARSKVGTNGNDVLFTGNGVVSTSADRENTVNPNNIPISQAGRDYADNNELTVLAGQNGSALTYAAIRMARLVDNYLQRLNLAGTSLVNRVLARFGERPKDQLLWQAQYLGGMRYDFKVGDMLSNIETGSQSASQVNNAFNYDAGGSQTGQSTGIIYKDFNGKELKFHSGRDYGILMCIGSLVPYTGYYQGLHKSWSHGTLTSTGNDNRASYFTPEFANAGLQPIKKSEIFGDAASSATTLDDIFGYSERYGEYAFQQDVIDGDIVLSATSTAMNALHMFREFSAGPVLTPAFTMIDPDARESLDRIFNYLKTGDPDNPQLLDHFERFFVFSVNANRGLASSMLPDLFEDNNHGNVISLPVGGSRF